MLVASLIVMLVRLVVGVLLVLGMAIVRILIVRLVRIVWLAHHGLPRVSRVLLVIIGIVIPSNTPALPTIVVWFAGSVVGMVLLGVLAIVVV